MQHFLTIFYTKIQQNKQNNSIKTYQKACKYDTKCVI